MAIGNPNNCSRGSKSTEIMADAKYMQMAMNLAGKGRRSVFPNPMVGCVVVNDGKIVGKGYHEYFGGPHAETNALTDAGKKAAGATLYVTLEPCDHHGKTPPCTRAILRSGIKRVVVAMADPDRKIRGRGLRRLSENGLEVVVGLLKKQAAELNREYVKSRKNSKPRVTVKVAMSIDGKIASRTGDSKWISSKKSRAMVHRLRTRADAVLVGKNTVLRDDPQLTSHGLGRNPVRVILDKNLRLPLRSKVFDGSAPTLVLHGSKVSNSRLSALKRKRILTLGMSQRGGEFDFREIVDRLRSFSLDSILIEGGGETIASAINAGVVNDLMVFVAPIIVGGREATSPVEGVGVASVREALEFRKYRVSRIGRDLLITARIDSVRG
jgi:diaminohydroxyphosphoribosylaminopyrimidine deaminase/5-amino-6-(5-phosphoribosylamino)uracil reductase